MLEYKTMDETRAKIDAKIAELEQIKEELLTPTKVILESLEDFRLRVGAKPNSIKIDTGVFPIDHEMGGFAEGTFIQIAGESFAGKTQLVLKILGNIAKHSKALLFSFEMYENVLVQYLKDLDHIQAENLKIDQDHRSLTEIESIIKNFVEDGGVFVAIDSRMKIHVSNIKEEHLKNSTISRELSRICQKYGAIILLINQISDYDLKSGRFSLKGSGDQVYDSDVIFYITVENKGSDNEQRMLFCDKDRINKKRWRANITERAEIVIEYQTNNDGLELPPI
jgi:replicative DNA helicase